MLPATYDKLTTFFTDKTLKVTAETNYNNVLDLWGDNREANNPDYSIGEKMCVALFIKTYTVATAANKTVSLTLRNGDTTIETSGNHTISTGAGSNHIDPIDAETYKVGTAKSLLRDVDTPFILYINERTLDYRYLTLIVRAHANLVAADEIKVNVNFMPLNDIVSKYKPFIKQVGAK